MWCCLAFGRSVFEKMLFFLRFADLAATYSPAS
ncbi:hypothetical protein J2Z31_004068 [Sinorhizobium kostiense]|uniref:Transposase n=1 Tax=Sinorhizobium kostiense TaxID=76747 RepID=A0ABS4R3T9_9HYPH|nr:hypothetical protein [Sinorhizobium kostiense]